MRRALYLAIGSAAGACSLPPFDSCPCTDSSCQIDLNRCITISAVPTSTSSLGCVVYDRDGRFYCYNNAPSDLLSAPDSKTRVNTLRSDYSWFICWGTGPAPIGGTTTWFLTLGEDSPECGWLPSSEVLATREFEEDPAAFGFLKCDASPPCRP